MELLKMMGLKKLSIFEALRIAFFVVESMWTLHTTCVLASCSIPYDWAQFDTKEVIQLYGFMAFYTSPKHEEGNLPLTKDVALVPPKKKSASMTCSDLLRPKENRISDGFC